MKWVLYLFIIKINIGLSQNLIPNPSFELMDSCSVGFDNIPTLESTVKNYCKNWFDNETINYSTSNYLSNCLHPTLNVPANAYGYSFAQHGNKYVGFILDAFHTTNKNVETQREHISIKIIEPLIRDSAYCISFFYKNSQGLNKNYSLDNIGVLFTYDSLKTDTVFQNNADVRTERGILLTNNQWQEFSGYYIAKGGEEFFNLGMFGEQDETELDTDYEGYIAFYYFIDNISVTLCDKDSIFNVYLELNANVFTPNGDGINDVYTIKHQNIVELNVQVYNRWGNLVRHYNGLTTEWLGNNDNGKPLSDGVYFIVVNAIDKFGETHQKTKTVTILRKL